VVGGGGRNTWLEVVLATGRNRQIRRMCSACGHDVLRLIRIAIGPLELGELPKGAWRALTAAEISSLVDSATGNSGL
jgi:23S rRNA pseudouridine2605 synthase